MKNYIILATIILCSVKFYGQGMIFTENITATKSHLGEFGSVVLQIDDAGNDGIITRPLIVAEGFESGLLGQENEFGENNIEEFIEDLEQSRSADLRNLLTNQTEFVYGDQNYDIIYVNWDNPRAHLQLNAFVLEEVINWVNQEKAPNADQNVVLGQSMGGVIARYALADMEDDPNLDHDTKLYISHDAPHQGANIPIGIQYFARHLADQFVKTPLGDFSFEVGNDSEASIEEINSLFNEPGTQQLLAEYITPSFGLDNSAFEAFQTDLQSIGYPTQTRNIAISNGSHCANTQDYDYNASLFRMNGKARTGVLADLLGSFLGIADDIALAIIFDEPGLVLGVLPGSSQFDLDFNAKALPIANTNANVYKGKVSYTKKLFWFLNITVNITDRSYDNPVNLSYDKYAGGRYELFDQVNNIDFFNDDDGTFTQFQADLLNVLVGSANMDFNVEQTFGFIPVPSALDVGGGTTTLSDSDYFKTYGAANPPTGNLSIPFHNFITAYLNNNSDNEEHISFNFRNGDWLATELDTIVNNEEVFDCSVFCSTNTSIIQGPDSICTSGTYTLNSGNYSLFWTVTSGQHLVSLSSNDNSVIVTKLNPETTGMITLEVFINSGTACSNQTTTVVKNIFLSAKPIISFDNTGLRDAILSGTTLPDESPFLIESGDIINITTIDTPTQLQWKYTGFDPYSSCLIFPNITAPNSVDGIVPLIGYSFMSSEPNSIPLSSSPAISIPSNNEGYLQVEVTAVNECGCDTNTNVYVKEGTGSNTPPNGSEPPLDFSISPNPYTAFDFGLIVNIFRNESTPTGQPLPVYSCTFEILNTVTGASYYSTSFLLTDSTHDMLILPSCPSGTHVAKLDYSGQTVTKLLVVE
ncbi:T9SS C-terminal target domain-containing protein [Hyunsoonleella sp. 2307UL5-6]|uniref:T9SS C-terminal target domain-containing protein n=1 Tax=Hyunsoonleella sp. 2307UL5-6 TaxID=3384768 RepID=UPI0039BD15CC